MEVGSSPAPLPQLTHVVADLVDRQLTGAHRVVGGRVAGALEVGAVHRRRLPARLGDCNVEI